MHDFIMWGLVALIVFEAFAGIVRVGRPRQALTGRDAAATTVQWTLMALAVLYIGGAL